jgi:hypothetical protein
MNSSTSRVAIVTLVVAFVVAAGFWGYEVWQNQQWKSLVHAYAASQGNTRATQDFLDGKLQLYVMDEPEGYGKHHATNDEGPFQIVSVSYNPNMFQHRYTSEVFIEAYNKRMRSLHEHPERSIIRTNAQGRIK